MPDDVVQCFIEQHLTEPFHHLSAAAAAADNDDDDDDDVLTLCEAVFSGIGDVAQLPHDSLSPTLHSLIGGKFTAACQLLPTPHEVSRISH